MKSRYDVNETEVIPDEDWCSACRQKVVKWQVSMESDSEGNYQPVRRCPHCDAKSLADSSSRAIIATVAFFAGCGATWPVWQAIVPGGYQQHFWIAMVAVGGTTSALAYWGWTQFLYRSRPKS